jgi:hypothetical protein
LIQALSRTIEYLFFEQKHLNGLRLTRMVLRRSLSASGAGREIGQPSILEKKSMKNDTA